jgi:hypothetical protein
LCFIKEDARDLIELPLRDSIALACGAEGVEIANASGYQMTHLRTELCLVEGEVLAPRHAASGEDAVAVAFVHLRLEVWR